jgi:probable blue pigment (indigoidine) exporter
MKASATRLTLATALAPLTWGSTYAVTTQWLPPGRPLFTAAVRALPAGLVLLAASRRLPSGAWWWRVAILGTLNIGAFFALLFVAADRLPGGMAAVLGAVQPLIVAGLSPSLLGRRPGLLAYIAGFIGVIGVALVVLQSTNSPDPLGVAAGLGGAVSMAAGIVLGKRWGRPEGVSVLTFTGWQLLVGGVLLAPSALLLEGFPIQVNAMNLAGYAYLALINTLLAYVLWFRGGAALPSTSLSFLSLLSPVAAALIGWMALSQALRPLQLLGLVIALASTVLGQLGAGARTGAAPTGRTRAGAAMTGQRTSATTVETTVARTTAFANPEEPSGAASSPCASASV